jgi:pimeloyl-ACP methyl ester carboxylesterase
MLKHLMFQESPLRLSDGVLRYRHTQIDPARPSLLFIHGLGESGLCFIEAFREPALSRFNILVPDLLGFGKSTGTSEANYTFSAQIERLIALIEHNKIPRVYLVGHSMGGDIGTELSYQKPDKVAAFINVEGSLTASDRFITDKALEAEQNRRFEVWLREDLRRGEVHDWSATWPTCIRYAASLEMCQPEAFLASAREIRRLNDGTLSGASGIIGDRYMRLNVPRAYCWGAESLTPASRAWLERSSLVNERFDGAYHWVMLDRPEAFYRFVSGFFWGIA